MIQGLLLSTKVIIKCIEHLQRICLVADILLFGIYIFTIFEL